MAITRKKEFTHPAFGTFTVQWSDRLRASIKVTPEGRIVVTAPRGSSDTEALRILADNKEKVLQALSRTRQREKVLPRSGPGPAGKENLDDLFEKAQRSLPARLSELAALYGFKVNGISLGAPRRKWGSCNCTLGTIQLNIALANLPAFLGDFIMLHELCHLHHPDHGPLFHQELENLGRRHLNWTVKSYMDRYGEDFLRAYLRGGERGEGDETLSPVTLSDLEGFRYVVDILMEVGPSPSSQGLSKVMNGRIKKYTLA